MNEQSKQNIIDRLHKIKALSERGVGGEAENAAKLLAKMLAKHRMSMDDLVEAEPEEILRKRIDNEGDSSWLRSLYGSIARYFDCRFAYVRSGGKWTIVGHTEDIECVKYLFVVAKRQIEASVFEAKSRGEIYGRTDYNNYRLSMVDGFESKLVEIKKGISNENPGYAIVLRTRSQKVNDWVEDHCQWKTGKRVRYAMNRSAYSRGKEINISTGINGRGTERITGQMRLTGK